MFMLQLSILLSINLLSAIAQSDETLVIAQYRLRVDPVQSGLGTDWQGGTDVVSYANSINSPSKITLPELAHH